MQSKGFRFEKVLDNESNRKNHLLAIAINDYVHCPKLNNATKDVEDFIELMLEKFEFEQENITFLKDKYATKNNIIKHFRQLIKSLSANDNLIIYFSGHGEFDDIEDEGYWLTQEVQQGNHANYLPNTRIKRLISRIKAHHVFLIADSCFSGALFDKNTKSLHEVYERDASRWGLTSGRNEIVTDGKPGENSPFAKSLLYALRNTSEPLSILKLCQNVQDNTTINANQSPRFERIDGSGHRGGQFVFWLRMREKDEILIKTQKRQIPTNIKTSSSNIIRKHKIGIKEFSIIILMIIILWGFIEVTKINNKNDEITENQQLEEDQTNDYADKDFYDSLMIKVEKSYFFNHNEKVDISSFYVSKYKITINQFKEFINSTGYRTDAERLGYSYVWNYSFKDWEKKKDTDWQCDENGSKRMIQDFDFPVVHVSWNDIQEYCKWLNSISGKKYRIPTEDEWEILRRVHFKNDSDLSFYHYPSCNDIDNNWAVDETFLAFENLNDEIKNVYQHSIVEKISGINDYPWEWCYYHVPDGMYFDYSKSKIQKDWLKAGKNKRLARLSSSLYIDSECYVLWRIWFHKTVSNGFVGFRIVHDASSY